ncbi:MAG: hypothetical protein IT384_24570 [Deltaproteobacteria bacterium]|nr:hypothetical protein [Deltaproteobacteria bacterium]
MPRVTFGSFALDAPPEWTLSTVILAGPVEEAPAAGGLMTAKAARPFQQNLVATMEQVDAKETPESYVKKQLEGLRKAGVSRQETAPPEKVKLKSGTEGLVTEQVVVGPSGERVRQLQLVTIKDGVAHTLIASHLDGVSFSGARAAFKSMLLSFG